MKAPRSVVIANPHTIGDIMMMFPLGGAIRRQWPQVRLTFVGHPYLQSLVQACEFFDGFIDSNEVKRNHRLLKSVEPEVFFNPFSDEHLARAAFLARVPIRVGNLLKRGAIYCNRFVAYRDTRHKHMVTFAMSHLRPLGLGQVPIPSDHRQLFGLTRVGAAPEKLRQQLDPARFNLILHPKSGGSAREWPLRNYLELARALHRTQAFKLFVTGTQKEREIIARDCPELLDGLATDLMGALSFEDLLTFVNAADGVLASSTGPLHLAAGLGRHALGLYATLPGLDPNAWRPLGPLARTLCAPGQCRPRVTRCPKKTGPPCACTEALKPDEVMSRLVMPALEQHRDGRAGATASAL